MPAAGASCRTGQWADLLKMVFPAAALGCTLGVALLLLNSRTTVAARGWGSYRAGEVRRGMEEILSNTPWQMPKYAFEDVTSEADFGLLSGSSYARPAAQRPYGDRFNDRDGRLGLPFLQRAKQLLNKTNRRVRMPAIQTIGAIIFLIVSWYFVRLGVKQYLVVPLEAMLTGEPFPPARFATPEEVQEAKRELKETHAPSKIAHLNAFRQGELLDDHVAELYLAALQDRIAAEDTLPDTFIFSWWRRYCPDQKPGDPPVHLPKLSATELQRCEAAKFILFPLKLYTTEEGDDGNNSFFHFALGVIDRENHVVRIVDCLREEHSYYTPALKQLQMLAHELEWQIDVQSNAYRTPSQYTISRQAPEPGFSSLKPKSGYEGTYLWRVSTGLLMLNNAATIAEGRAPQPVIGNRRQLAEVLWLELALKRSREAPSEDSSNSSTSS